MWGYSISALVNHSIEKDWVNWMQEIHIHEVLETKCFIKAQFSKIHHETVSYDATNYNVVYFANSREDLEKYYKDFAPLLRQKVWVLFREQVTFFRTELEFLDEYIKK